MLAGSSEVSLLIGHKHVLLTVMNMFEVIDLPVHMVVRVSKVIVVDFVQFDGSRIYFRFILFSIRGSRGRCRHCCCRGRLLRGSYSC